MLNIENAIQIFKNDIRSVFKNKATIIVILAICLIPCLYTLINVQAIWNPYSDSELENLKIAVVNNDSGSSLNNQKINVGKKVANELKKNHEIGWTIVSNEEAKRGIRKGKYISEIYIPKNFSKSLLKFTEGKPRFSSIEYIKNTNQSPMSGIISDAAATELTDKININFINTIVVKSLNYSNDLGYKANKNKVKLFTLKNYSVALSENFNTTVSALNDISDISAFLSNLIRQSNIYGQSNFGNISTSNKSVSDFLELNNSVNNSIENLVHQNSLNSNELFSDLNYDSQKNNDLLQNNIEMSNKRLDNMQDQISIIKSFLINTNSNEDIQINHFINQLDNINNNITDQKNNNDKIIQNSQQVFSFNSSLLVNQQNLVNQLSDQLINLSNNYNNETAESLNNILQAEDKFNLSLKNFSNSLEKLNESNSNSLNNISIGLNTISQTSLNMSNQLSYYEPIIKKIGSQLSLISNNKMVKIINIVNSNPKLMGKAISSPFKVKSENIYPIKTFGSAFAPSYIAISIWVGCAMLVSVLSTDVSEDFLKRNHFTIRERYIGKLLIFSTLSLVQTLIIINSTILVLHVHIESLLLYEIAGILISLTFSAIVYSLVSIFGNLGKAFSVILVALQIAGSGAVYPIQLEPTAYRLVQPFFPFTYSVGMLREAIGGPSVPAVSLDIFVLLLLLVIVIIVSIIVKPHTYKLTEKLQNKFIKAGISDF